MSRKRVLGPEPIVRTQANTEVATEHSNNMSSGQQFQKHTSTTPSHAHNAPYRANQKSIDFAFKKLLEFRPRLYIPTQQRFPKNQWPELGISCGHLEFDTGKVTPTTAQPANGQSFLKLISPEWMHKLALSSNLHKNYGPGTLHEYDNVNYQNAWRVANVIIRCLGSVYEDKCLLINRTSWNDREPNDFELYKLHTLEEGVNWSIPWLLQPKDRSLSHVNCFLAQDQSLDEDTLVFSEVWGILMLTALISRGMPEPAQHTTKIVPVTMVSGSARNFRIVQGWVDGDAGKIRINKSPVMSLGNAKPITDKKVWNGVLNILRWLLAEPTGKIT
ncbi:hypothetical protein F5Y12DRAFT_765488 [Xylaria sp. FL1777]|nr:hypothetical protein F5Y12DRAFT_765488 [Xylaria sp. FL1777]